MNAGGTVISPTGMKEYKKWEKGLLRPDGRPGFDTPTGKFEIWSTILEEHGYNPLPDYTEPTESPISRPDLLKNYPLIFNSGARVTTDFHAQHHGVKGLLKERPEPTVTIHTRDAAARGIQHGDRVVIRSPRGTVKLRALVTDDIIPGVIEANMGGGCHVGPPAWQEGNVNLLTDLSNYDPISGFPVYKALLCEVSRDDGSSETVSIGSGEGQGIPDIAAPGSSRSRIYFDNNATTPVHPSVCVAMKPFLTGEFGNPSSIYRAGKKAKAAIETSRRSLAQVLNCTARRIIFTGCCTEANNTIIKGIAFAHWNGDRHHIITTSVEHSSVLEPCGWLEKFGFRVTYLPVDETGMVRPEILAAAITQDTLLVSIMAANNETGTIMPIGELCSIAHQKGALFHTDATQAIGKIPIDIQKLDVDFLSLSAHKMYGPKGVGALYMKKDARIDLFLHGGEQEGRMRAGTENVAGIVGLGKAAELARTHLLRAEELSSLRDRLEDGIREIIPAARLNGHPTQRLPNTLNMVLPGYRGESLVLALDTRGIEISAGSACHSGSPEPSHVLRAMNLSDEDVHCSIRISLGTHSTRGEVERFLNELKDVVTAEKPLVRFVTCR